MQHKYYRIFIKEAITGYMELDSFENHPTTISIANEHVYCYSDSAEPVFIISKSVFSHAIYVNNV